MKIFGQTQYQVYRKITEDKKFYKELLEKLIVQVFYNPEYNLKI